MQNNTQQRSGFWQVILKYIVPLVISIGLCTLLFRGIDFGEMMNIIRNDCNFTYIAIGLAIAVLSHIFRALRWGIQLRALNINTPVHALIYSIFGTYAVNLVFPRLGEVWRTGYIAQRQDAPFATVFGSMVADRLADTLTVLIITAGTFMAASGELLRFLSENGDSYAAIARILSSPWLWVSITALITLVWYFFARNTTNHLVVKIKTAVRELWQGFAIIVTMPGKGRWLIYTAGVWGCYFMQMYVCFFAFPFTQTVLQTHGILAVLVTFVLGSISMGVPSNGGIGPWQWAVIFGLGIYGVAAPQAGAFANLVLGCNTLLLILLGIITFIGIAFDKKTSHRPATEILTKKQKR